jgi:hypothetical protein
MVLAANLFRGFDVCENSAWVEPASPGKTVDGYAYRSGALSCRGRTIWACRYTDECQFRTERSNGSHW